jgi:hypothetical protein
MSLTVVQAEHLLRCVRFEIFTAVTMKNVVFLDMKTQLVPHRTHITSPLQSPASECCCNILGFQSGDCEECRLLGAFLRSVLLLLVTGNVPSTLILFTVMMDTIRSSETSVLTRFTRLHIPEDCILHSYRRENLLSYIALTG